MNKNYLTFLRRICFSAVLLAGISLHSHAQTEHPITNEGDALDDFIENTSLWEPGDIILLVSEGEYVISDTINITQDVTIMADPELATRPVLTFWGNGFMPADSISITLKGFDANGLTMQEDEDGVLGEHRANFLEYGRNYAFGGGNLLVEDIEAYGFKMGIQLYYNSWHYYESLIVNNVIWHDFTDWAIDPRLNATKYLQVTNSTFYNIAGFLKNPYFNKDSEQALGLVAQKIVIDHNTFYDLLGPGGADALLQINDPNDGQVNLMFTNNIVSTLRDAENARPFRLRATAGVFTINNNAVHNFDSPRGEGSSNLDAVDEALDNVLTSDNLADDPGFANTAAADFTIPGGSPLLTASTTGGAIGDPRWTGDEMVDPVFPTDVPVAEILIAAKDEAAIDSKGGSIDIVAIALPGTAEDRTITWSVDDETLATIDENGTLTALENGTVTVTATASDGSGVTNTIEVEITGQAVITAIAVSAEGDISSLTLGDSVQMIATLTPENPDNPAVMWRVDNEEVATISSEGMLTSVALGDVWVKAFAVENPLMVDSVMISVVEEPITGIGDDIEVSAAIYPNPVGNEIHVKSASVVKVTINSLSGKAILSETLTGDGSINISRLPAGIYLAVIESKKGAKSLKIIKE